MTVVPSPPKTSPSLTRTYKPKSVLYPNPVPFPYVDYSRITTVAGFITVSSVLWWYPQLTLELDCSPDEYYTDDLQLMKRLLYWLLPGERIPLEDMKIPSGSECILDVVEYRIIGFR